MYMRCDCVIRLLEIVISNDRIFSLRCPPPEILYESSVTSTTTSEPSGVRARIMVVIVAGCRGVRTFRDCHNNNPLHSRFTTAFIRAYYLEYILRTKNLFFFFFYLVKIF